MDLAAVRTDIYEYARGALGRAGAGQHPDETSARAVEELLQSARAAVDGACADFAESWNSECAGAVAEYLPPEILATCLRAVPFGVLITATHVSRKWRAVALSDRSLWATFRAAGNRNSSGDDDERMLVQLAAMLDRSRPCPFTLRLPYPSRGYERIADRLEALLRSEFWRLRHYDGPFDLYQRVNGQDTPTPHLLTLRLVGDELSADRPVFRVPSDWATRMAPNLQRLELDMPTLILPPTCAPTLLLTHLQMSAELSPVDYRNLFQWGPRLISLDIRDVENTSRLPPGPLPSTLTSVSLSSPLGRGTDFGPPLAAWAGYPIQQLTAYGAMSLAQPLDIFLSFFPGAVTIHIAHDTVQVCEGTPDGERVTGSPWRCQVMPSIWHRNQLHALRGACAARLTALSVPLDVFAFLMHAQLVAPQLVRFALHMDAPAAREARRLPTQLPSAECWLEAPRLRELALRVPYDATSVQPVSAPAQTVAALRLHLRDLIRFDAPRLQTIVVQGMRDNISTLSCADLTQYADSYREDYSFSWRRRAAGAITP